MTVLLATLTVTVPFVEAIVSLTVTLLLSVRRVVTESAPAARLTVPLVKNASVEVPASVAIVKVSCAVNFLPLTV